MNLADALQFAKRGFGSERNKHSNAALLMTGWAAQRMTLEMVKVAVPETTAGKIRKDAESEFGKRLCASGSLVQIEVVKDPEAKHYSGVMMTPGGDVVAFLAVKGTGELVAKSNATICGVSTGIFTYSNSGGGTTHALEVVGIFDLPENRGTVDAGAPRGKPVATEPEKELNTRATNPKEIVRPTEGVDDPGL